MAQIIGGTADFKIDGQVYPIKGDWTYNPGFNKRTGVVGGDDIHGFTETPQFAKLEGVITARAEVDIEALITAFGVTVNLKLRGPNPNSPDTFALIDAVYTGDGNITTAEGEIQVVFEGRGKILKGTP